MSEPTYVFSPPPITSLPVAGATARYAVRRIYCVGRNYLEHIREFDNDEKAPPIFFSKPRDTIVQDGETIPYPTATSNFHFEVELAVAMQGGGYNIADSDALNHVFGYGIALDMTRRDVQRALVAKSAPWEVCKGFDDSCPCSAIYPVSEVGHMGSGRIQLTVNGETKQDSDLSLMIWNVPQIIANLSRYFSLQPGDLILTGTPHGVGAVQSGDVMVASIEKLGTLTIQVGAAAATT